MKKPALSELTLEEKVSQLIMINQYALFDKEVDGKFVPRSYEEIDEIMEKQQFGGMWYCGNITMRTANVAEAAGAELLTTRESRDFLKRISEKVRIPMLRGIDCEMGPGVTFCDATVTLTCYAVGAADDEQLTFDLFKNIAREIKSSGGTWRWQPVVDLCNRFNGAVQGRSFSDSDMDLIMKHSVAAIKGMQSVKMPACVKHFPSADPYEFRDAHFTPSVNLMSYEEWKETQGKIFKNAIDNGVWSIMVGHYGFPAVDDEKLNSQYVPATLSRKIITGLLREEMGFEEIIVTDAIGMAALTTMCSEEEKLIRMINAGNDLLLSVDLKAHETLCNAVRDGKISMQRINESCQRVLDFKEKMGLFDGSFEETAEIEDIVKETTEISRKISEKSVTMLRDRSNIIPVKKENIKKVAITFSSYSDDFFKYLDVMKEEFEKRGAEVVLSNNFNENGTEYDDRYNLFLKLVEENDLIIHAAHIGPHCPVGMPTFFNEELRTFEWTFDKENYKSIGVSLGYPYIGHDVMSAAGTYFNIYSIKPEAQKAFVKAIYGEIPIVGKSPVDVEPKRRYVYC